MTGRECDRSQAGYIREVKERVDVQANCGEIYLLAASPVVNGSIHALIRC